MRRMRTGPFRRLLAVALLGAALVGGDLVPVHGQPAASFGLDEVFSYPFPSDMTAAARAPRIAWAVNDRGQRNVWVAEGPAFTPRQLTPYAVDDGQELTSLQLTPSGDAVVYVRGGDHGANFDDSLPVNPLGSPLPPKVQIWSVPFAGGAPRLVGDGDLPAISPRGDVVAFERERQIWIAPLDGSTPATRAIAANGSNGDVVWAPDGGRLAFVSNRGDHAFIGIYTNEQTAIQWLAPSTSRDGSPRWSPDGRRLAFVRRPGMGGPPVAVLTPRHVPWALWVADTTTGDARPMWRPPETLRGSFPGGDGVSLQWAARDRIVFVSYHGGWPQLYSLPSAGGEPLLLTPASAAVENVRLAPDGVSMVFAANTGPVADDLDRRHLFRVPVDRAAPELLTPGTGLEWSPVLTSDQRHLAFISATAQRPPLAAVMPAAGGGAMRLLGEDRLAAFPATQLVTPRPVTYKASDGVTVHAQLFEPHGAPGARRPAIVYVHGGPKRQMLLGWHMSDYYARAYAANQYLASRGFVVLAINYRLGIGYGYEFDRALAAGAQGASEYLDVKAAGEYLRSLPQVDGARLGIYGGSYGGFLTALALGRNSDLFAAGVDIHGVHDFTVGGSGSGAALQAAMNTAGRSVPPDRDQAAEVAWASSPVSSVETWKSPVLLIHGDDDRNVRFSQTVDLARRLAAARIPFEEIVIPDDTHHWMRHANALRVYTATAEWFERRFTRRTEQ
jgi:dipeptidyl aminopeptidase/acylaminoacyl peptidase